MVCLAAASRPKAGQHARQTCVFHSLQKMLLNEMMTLQSLSTRMLSPACPRTGQQQFLTPRPARPCKRIPCLVAPRPSLASTPLREQGPAGGSRAVGAHGLCTRHLTGACASPGRCHWRIERAHPHRIGSHSAGRPRPNGRAHIPYMLKMPRPGRQPTPHQASIILLSQHTRLHLTDRLLMAL